MSAKKQQNDNNLTYLILRFSSIGDVAMTVPIISSVSKKFPDHQFVVVSRKMLAPLFESFSNVIFISADLGDRHKGLRGLIRFSKEIESVYSIDGVVDLHDVLRSKIIRTFFRLKGKKVAAVNKGRKEKKQLLIQSALKSKPLISTFERYQRTFAQMNLNADMDFERLAISSEKIEEIKTLFGKKKEKWIGVAPFAKHKSKMLPFATTKKLIRQLSALPDIRIFLFGAGAIETEMLQQWGESLGNVTCVAGVLSLDKELALMTQLDTMICMDSANQHLASLVALPTISIWGGTHPFMGFYGWKQNPKNAIQIEMDCRPCTVYGTKKCKHIDFPCLRSITVEQITAKVEEIINQ